MEDSDIVEVLVRFNSSTVCSPKCSYESITSSQILKISKSVVPELFIAELFKVFKKRIPNLQHAMVAKLHRKFDEWIPLKKSDRDFVADGDCFLLLPMHSADAFTDSDCIFDIRMDMSMTVKDRIVPENNDESLKEILRNIKENMENRFTELDNRAKNSDANIQKTLAKLDGELTTVKSNQQKIYKLIEEYFTDDSSNASYHETSEVQFGDSTTSNTEQLISKLGTPNTNFDCLFVCNAYI
ncbi:hypothetical protein DdX_11456 [Ditylenchus destructor]|uniref:Uncharacterized protein n=1 Tax=Ditylenchus destructor TaxID=166010 RepID=A0AAD4MWP4_9BILA|nr:hypothetical protein DdX_11456 [Ditylenchus destructor]